MIIKASLTLLLTAYCLFASGENSNRPAPGFSLMDSHFTQHDPQNFRGRIVLVDFMKTECPACNALADDLVELHSRYGDKVVFLSIVTLPDTFDTADKFAAAHQAKWPILFDSGQVMMSYLQLKPTGNMNVHFPHVFVIDQTGMIRHDVDGSDTKALTVGALSAEIEKLLKK